MLRKISFDHTKITRFQMHDFTITCSLRVFQGVFALVGGLVSLSIFERNRELTHPEMFCDAENILEYWMPSVMTVTSVMRTSSCLSRWVRTRGPLTFGGDSHTARISGIPGNVLDGGLITAMFPLRNRVGLSCFLVTGSSLEMFQISSHIYHRSIFCRHF
jgi:hypothetical protein